MGSDYDKHLGSLAKRYEREKKIDRYHQYIVDEMIEESEFENTYEVVVSPWGVDYYYSDILYYEGKYSFEDYVREKYGISSGKESMKLFSLYRQAVYDKTGYKD